MEAWAERAVDVLVAAEGRPVSGEVLATEAGVSRAAVWKVIERLRRLGYEVIASPRKGYRLISVPDVPYPWEVRRQLVTRSLGQVVHYFAEVASTNDIAKLLAADGVPEGTLVVADRQTAGRGRRGRAWTSPNGGLWLSVVLRPSVPPAEVALLTTVTAVAVARTLASTGLAPAIKWPNDILLTGRKVTGILVELNAEADMVRWAVVGIGLNATVDVAEFPPETRQIATSVQAEMGHPVRKVQLLQQLLTTFDQTYAEWLEQGQAAILNDARRYSCTLGRQVRVSQGSDWVEGLALDLAEDGSLFLRLLDGQIRRLTAGDVSLRPVEA